VDSSHPVTLRNRVELRFRIHDSGIDFGAYQLVRDIADDHLIATMIELRDEAAPIPVVLLTKDTGLKLKARTQGFLVASLPESALLPDEVLPAEKKIKELEARLLELQNARPRPRLAFSDGSSILKLTFQSVEQLSESDRAHRMADLRGRYPAMAKPIPTPQSDATPNSLHGLLNAASRLSGIDPDWIVKYNDSLLVFFSEYEEYLEDLAVFHAWETRTAAMNIVVVNDGSSPAEDVDIFMHFPGGFELFNKQDYRKEPDPPDPPRKPKSIWEESMGGVLSGKPNFWDHHLYSAELNRSRIQAEPSNVSAPKIKRTNSYDVNVNVCKAKHGIDEPLDIIYLTFEPSAPIRGFTIDYTIHSSNLPTSIKGKLNVIV
jgi:hypothetical protein